MHAEHLQCLAAVRLSLTAGVAGATVQIRLYRAAITDSDIRDAITDSEHFHAEFMTEDARELDERHLSEIAAHIRTADADGAHRYERLACAWRAGFGNVQPPEATGFGEAEGFHERGLEKLTKDGKDER
jgi:hypothetical protein